MSVWVHRLSNIDTEKKQGDCAECGEGVRLKRKAVRQGKVGWRCYAADRQHPRNNRLEEVGGGRSVLRSRLGDAGFAALLAAQGGRCAICRRVVASKFLRVDHCHVTGVIRGLLCQRCNPGLGFFQEDPDLLNRALEYLASPPSGGL